jgi:hypothetical protein
MPSRRIVLAVALGVGALIGLAPTATASTPVRTTTTSSGGYAACFWAANDGYCIGNPLDDLPVSVPKLPRPPLVP